MIEPRIKWPTDMADLGVAMLVTVDVEISDQYGTSQNMPVGIFTDRAKMQEAVLKADGKYNRRTRFYFTRVTLNAAMGLPDDPRRYWAFVRGEE